MKETLRHKEAFETYYAMGAERSLASLAGDCGVSEKSVKTWSKSFDWQARIVARDQENARRLQQKTDEKIVNVKALYRKVVGSAISDFVNRLKAGEIEVDSVTDLERLVKLDLLLMGEATETHAHRFEVEEVLGIDRLSDAELRQRLAEAADGALAGELPPKP